MRLAICIVFMSILSVEALAVCTECVPEFTNIGGWLVVMGSGFYAFRKKR